MSIEFIYKDKALEPLIEDGYKSEDVDTIKGFYDRFNDIVFINLSAKQYKKPDWWTIAEVCTAIQHEYLHKEIHKVRKELENVSNEMEKEENIIAEITREEKYG